MSSAVFVTPAKRSGLSEDVSVRKRSASEATTSSINASGSPNIKVPENVRRTKFSPYSSTEQTESDGLYRIVAAGITKDEFCAFCELNLGAREKFVWRRGKILIPLYQAANETSVHEAGVGIFAGIIYVYQMQHPGFIGSTMQYRQTLAAFSRQPDFGIKSRARLPDTGVTTCNVVGEIMYSQSLANGHGHAVAYLAPGSNICAVILVDIQYPYPEAVPPALRSASPVKLVYYYYPHPADAPEIVPTRVVSFGTAPLTAADMDMIVATTHCDINNIRGYLHTTMVPCNLANRDQYTETIPGPVLLRVVPEDVTITLDGVEHELDNRLLDLSFNLHDIQRGMTPASVDLPINET